MEEEIKKTKRKRFFAFAFDFFIAIFTLFIFKGIIGIFFKMDVQDSGNIDFYVLLFIAMVYLYFGELVFKNTLGKYIFGIEVVDRENLSSASVKSLIIRGLLKILWPLEGLVLLFAKSKKRIGDKLAKTIVINKKTNQYKLGLRLVSGSILLVLLYFGTTFSMSLAVRNTDFYKTSKAYLSESAFVEITGLPKTVIQVGDIVELVVPITKDDKDLHASVWLERIDSTWSVYYVKLLDDYSGRQFKFELESPIQKEYHENGQIMFEGAVIEKMKEGTCTWYHDNGQLKETSIWHKGMTQGKVSRFHANGKIAVEAYFDDGLKQGVAKIWHDNGQIEQLLYYDNDLITGKFISYHANGQISEKGAYKASERIGVWENYDENGDPLEIN